MVEEKTPAPVKATAGEQKTEEKLEKREPASAAPSPKRPGRVGDKATAGKQEKKEPEKQEKVEIEVPKNLKKLVEEIENLKVADLAELVKVLEKKFGVSASAMMQAPAGPGAGAGQAESTEQAKKFFSVVLATVGDKKIEVIKAVRDITQRGLKESKDLVDQAAEAPQPLKENVKKEEAEEMKKKLTAAGATVELK